MSEQTAKCRGCGRALSGKPYHLGGSAYHPDTKERCRHNFYGGFVCSRECDIRACLELERSMPGHDGRQRQPGQFAMDQIDRNWSRKNQ